MANLRVMHLSDVLKTAGAVWIETSDGTAVKVRQIKVAGTFQPDDPDITLVTSRGVGQFEDQRVKLDLDDMSMRVKDVDGRERTMLIGACVPS